MSELADLLERYRRGAELLAVATTGAAGPELDFKPDGKWSVRQIVCHLADSEAVAVMRFRQFIAEDNPSFGTWDQDAWAAKLGYEKRKISQALETFRMLRLGNYELLRDQPLYRISSPLTISAASGLEVGPESPGVGGGRSAAAIRFE